jgi:hypothetical protein
MAVYRVFLAFFIACMIFGTAMAKYAVYWALRRPAAPVPRQGTG